MALSCFSIVDSEKNNCMLSETQKTAIWSMLGIHSGLPAPTKTATMRAARIDSSRIDCGVRNEEDSERRMRSMRVINGPKPRSKEFSLKKNGSI